MEDDGTGILAIAIIVGIVGFGILPLIGGFIWNIICIDWMNLSFDTLNYWKCIPIGLIILLFIPKKGSEK